MEIEKPKRRRGRRAKFSEKTVSKTFTLYENQSKLQEDEGIELTQFARWLISYKQIEYLNNGEPESENEGVTRVHTISLYPEEIENIQGIDNFSNFMRHGIMSHLQEYKDKE